VDDLDSRVRLAAFQFLAEQTVLHPDTLPYEVLQRGFDFERHRVPLLGPQGIFKPAILHDMPISIYTAPMVEGRPRPYEDEIGPDGLIRYRYRGTDPAHRDNVGLRLVMQRRTPLIYLHGVVPGQYVATWPVYVVGDAPGDLCFTVAVDEPDRALVPGPGDEPIVASARRAYVTGITLRRLHQRAFRERILQAYQAQCTVCRFRRRELLDAAHILPDGHPRGEPIIPNGLALCPLHHAAFDRHILGIRPDLTVELRVDILREKDGPTLQHGLIRFQGKTITVPRRPESRPNPEFLAERYELFRKAG
jgi:putative restriction endonuclease